MKRYPLRPWVGLTSDIPGGRGGFNGLFNLLFLFYFLSFNLGFKTFLLALAHGKIGETAGRGSQRYTESAWTTFWYWDGESFGSPRDRGWDWAVTALVALAHHVLSKQTVYHTVAYQCVI